MNRTVEITIDERTWPKPPQAPLFPSQFHTGTVTENISIPAMLLMIGVLTTPPNSTGISLSEYWAWVRYLNAVTADTDLRLSNDFAELDAHQKTILSDDFGMGIPMYWMSQKLSFGLVCDGRYFIDRIAASVGAKSFRTGKRGPNKSPDFVTLDINGIWHVIECKGTQSGRDYRQSQLVGSNTIAGAIRQKNNVIFPSGYAGQRLACGVSISVAGDPLATNLKIIDPPNDDESFVIEEDNLADAKDTISRAVAATGLRLAGFQLTSQALASPDGPLPSSRRSTGRLEERRRAFVEERHGRVLDELRTRLSGRGLEVGGQYYLGRQVKLDLPKSVYVEGTEIRSVQIFQGVNSELVNMLQSSAMADFSVRENPLASYLGSTRVAHDDLFAQLNIGKTFYAEIRLLPD